LHTILHRTDLIVFPLTLQTITTAPMMSIWGKGGPEIVNVLFRFVCFRVKAMEYVSNIKTERSGRRVDTEVLDEDMSGMSDSVSVCKLHIDTYTYNLLLWNIPTNLQARYDLFCAKSAVKPQPTNQPSVCKRSWGWISYDNYIHISRSDSVIRLCWFEKWTRTVSSLQCLRYFIRLVKFSWLKWGCSYALRFE